MDKELQPKKKLPKVKSPSEDLKEVREKGKKPMKEKEDKKKRRGTSDGYMAA